MTRKGDSFPRAPQIHKPRAVPETAPPSLQVECPICEARAGHKCITAQGSERLPHIARVMRGNANRGNDHA